MYEFKFHYYKLKLSLIKEMPQMLEKVGKNFKIIRKIDEGAFGEIYQAINTKTNLEVAVKI